jgi:peptidoglycan hydrolase FlgJ
MDALVSVDYRAAEQDSIVKDLQHWLDKSKNGDSKTEDLRQLKEDKEGLKKVASTFEGMFVNLMMKEMRKTLHPEEGILPPSMASEIFQEMMDEKVSDDMARSGTLGVSEMIVRAYEKSIDSSKIKEVKSKVEWQG